MGNDTLQQLLAPFESQEGCRLCLPEYTQCEMRCVDCEIFHRYVSSLEQALAASDNPDVLLYWKIHAEQEAFKSYLLGLPPQKILEHASQYAVREDIVATLENMELDEPMAEVLLLSPTPLADVYDDFCGLDTEYTNTLHEVIIERAHSILRDTAPLASGTLQVDEEHTIRFDPQDHEGLCRLMDRASEFRGLMRGINDDGETIHIMIYADKVTVDTFQENGWIRRNTYWRDWSQEETFEGKWK